MGDKSEKLETVKVVLGTAFVVVMVGISFGLGWYANELPVIKQFELQRLIERISREVLPRGFLEVISVEPSSPAVLKPGEKLNVKFHYHLGSSETVQIWARPYTRGSRTPGYKAHGSSVYKKAVRESGIAEGWFCFDGSAVVDEIRINMRDVTTGKDVCTTSYRVDARWGGSGVCKKGQACSRRPAGKRIFIDVHNPDGETGWKDEYVLELKPTGNIAAEFGVDWFRPHRVASLSEEKPDFVSVLPEFSHEMQRHLVLKLGDTDNNQVVGVMDFKKPDKKYYPFDLYLDRDRDGNLAEDFIDDKAYIKGISVPYKDGTTEDYAVYIYSYSTDNEPIGIAYQSLAGRYGIFEADKKRIQVLVIDNSGNGIFNDENDVILLDWDLNGRIDGGHRADDDRPLYSLFELAGGLYQVEEFDAAGRRMVLRRKEAK